MRILSALSDLMVPVLIFYVVGLGLLMKQDVFGDFLNGAKDGCLLYTSPSPRDA